MTRIVLWVGVAVGVLISSAAARAHHGDADRYNQDVVTVTGTVVDVQMVNPHSHILLDVDSDGKTVRWQAELGAPQQIVKQFGWTPSTIKKGMKLTMIGRRRVTSGQQVVRSVRLQPDQVNQNAVAGV